MVAYFCCHEELLFSTLANEVMDTLKEIWCIRNGKGQCIEEPNLNTSLQYRHMKPVERFEALYQAEKLVVLPATWRLDDNQKYELKVWQVLTTHDPHREVYVVMPNMTIVKAAFVMGKVGILQKE